MQLNDDVVRSFEPAKIYKDDPPGRINSLDFHRTESLLVTAADDDSVKLYNTVTGQRDCVTLSRKYGCSNVQFTHEPTLLIYSSNKGSDHALRLCCITNNTYVRYFKGHSAKVTSLAMSPKSDMFMTASLDKTVRLWDLRTEVCQAVLSAPGVPTATFDHQGMVFAVACDSGIIKLYDASQYAAGPFDTFVVEELRNLPLNFTHLRFSFDGKLLLGVVEGRIYVLDAYDGKLLAKFSNDTPESGTAPEAAFSFDGKYVLSGCEDRSIRVWNVATQAEVACLKLHAATPTCLKWAPKRMMFASACVGMAMWMPDLSKLTQREPGVWVSNAGSYQDIGLQSTAPVYMQQ